MELAACVVDIIDCNLHQIIPPARPETKKQGEDTVDAAWLLTADSTPDGMESRVQYLQDLDFFGAREQVPEKGVSTFECVVERETRRWTRAILPPAPRAEPCCVHLGVFQVRSYFAKCVTLLELMLR